MGILREYIVSMVDCMSPVSRSLTGIVALIGAIGFLLTAIDPSGLPATSLGGKYDDCHHSALSTV
jgi:hypothetical protein